MTLYGSCFRVTGYVLVAFIAVYAYFYVECQREVRLKEEAEKLVVKEAFRHEETDIKDVPLNFCKLGESMNTDLGLLFMFGSSLPCPLVKLVSFLSSYYSQSELKAEDKSIYSVLETSV